MMPTNDSDKTKTKRAIFTQRAKPVGRPQSRFTPTAVVQTRVPVPMYKYCKMVQALRFNSLTEMFGKMVVRFLEDRPWDHGLYWRRPKAAITYRDDSVGKTGWTQINMHLDAKVKSDVELLCKALDISMATFCYTAIYWWIEYKYPSK